MDKKSFITIFGLMVGIAALAYGAGQVAPLTPVHTAEDQKYFTQLYFLDLNGDGNSGPRIGCGDGLVKTSVSVYASPSAETALATLLATKDREYGAAKLYNALWLSNLSVSSISVVRGVANVALAGQLALGGVCDAPRVKAQIERTVMQFPGIKSVKTTINGKDLDVVLSGKE